MRDGWAPGAGVWFGAWDGGWEGIWAGCWTGWRLGSWIGCIFWVVSKLNQNLDYLFLPDHFELFYSFDFEAYLEMDCLDQL